MSGEEQEIKSTPGGLRQNFGWPPFTVLDFGHGDWRSRRRAWIDLGLRGEVGRGENLLNMSKGVLNGYKAQGGEFPDNRQLRKRDLGAAPANVEAGISNYYARLRKGESRERMIEDAMDKDTWTGTSIFDPVLTELVYTWFGPSEGFVLDPFAGGPTRGIVASKLGLEYHGHELRGEQVEANRETATEILGLEERDRASWYEGDSRETLEQWDDGTFDLVMTCPPYFNLERYSEDPADISNLDDYDEFLTVYREILHTAAAKLKDDRFFALVVGNVRARKGGGVYHPLVSDTIRIMAVAGLGLYNEAIMRKSPASAALRAPRIFGSNRKLVTCHEYLLVFCKGDPVKAAENCGGTNRFSLTDSAEDWV